MKVKRQKGKVLWWFNIFNYLLKFSTNLFKIIIKRTTNPKNILQQMCFKLWQSIHILWPRTQFLVTLKYFSPQCASLCENFQRALSANPHTALNNLICWRLIFIKVIIIWNILPFHATTITESHNLFRFNYVFLLKKYIQEFLKIFGYVRCKKMTNEGAWQWWLQFYDPKSLFKVLGSFRTCAEKYLVCLFQFVVYLTI